MTHRDRGRSDLFIYLRIFVVLGITWIFGILVLFAKDGSDIEKVLILCYVVTDSLQVVSDGAEGTPVVTLYLQSTWTGFLSLLDIHIQPAGVGAVCPAVCEDKRELCAETGNTNSAQTQEETHTAADNWGKHRCVHLRLSNREYAK